MRPDKDVMIALMQVFYDEQLFTIPIDPTDRLIKLSSTFSKLSRHRCDSTCSLSAILLEQKRHQMVPRDAAIVGTFTSLDPWKVTFITPLIGNMGGKIQLRADRMEFLELNSGLGKKTFLFFTCFGGCWVHSFNVTCTLVLENGASCERCEFDFKFSKLNHYLAIVKNKISYVIKIIR